MKLLSLKVENFRCIRKAKIDFGPGLNVLYGPNDLGKSSLADAIRAALLLQTGSKDSEDFVPWGDSSDPQVEIVFQTEPQRIWRARKRFGTGAQAFLDESRDGADFHVEARGREVDGRLRELLRWGLTPPGGKGHPKGMPMTFLSTALLAEQDHVAAIFDQTLSNDFDESGKKWLVEALQAVAEDPLFKQVLGKVQAHVNEAFTDTGKRRTGKASPWTQIRDLIKQKEEYARTCNEQAHKSQVLESEIQQLLDIQLSRRESLDQAQGMLKEIDESHAQGHKRKEIIARLEERMRALGEITKASDDLRQSEERLSILVKRHEELCKTAQAAQSAFQETKRYLQEVKEQIAVEAHLLKTRDARTAIDEAERSLANVSEWRKKAAETKAQLESLKKSLLLTSVPTLTQVERLKQLSNDIQVARAQTDVGLQAKMRSKRPVRVAMRKDRGAPTQHDLADSSLEVSASREISFDIEDLVEITVSGGVQDARDSLAALENRWAKEAQPVLNRVGAAHLEDLVTMVAAYMQRSDEIAEKERIVSQLEQRVSDQPDWAGSLAQRRQELAAGEESLRGFDPKVVEKAASQLAVRSDTDVQRALRDAGELERRAEQAKLEAEEELRKTENELSARQREVELRRDSVTRHDEKGARDAVSEVERELSLIPEPPYEITDEALADARQQVRAAADEFNEIEDEVLAKKGALQHIGGDVAKQRAQGAAEAVALAHEQEHVLEDDYNAWELLRSTLKEAEQEEGVHLGKALGGPVAQRFGELTSGRYGRFALGPHLESQGIAASGEDHSISALSIGTRDQLSTIFRLSLAEQLQSTVLLDDQLTQSDHERLKWLRGLLKKLAATTQIIVLTCRPSDYLLPEELAQGGASAGDSSIRSIDLLETIGTPDRAKSTRAQ